MSFALDRIDRKGEGLVSVLLNLAVLFIIGSIIWQVVGSLYQRYEISLAVERTVNQVSVSTTDEEIWQIAAKEFKKLKLGPEHNPKNITVSRKYDKTTLVYEYTVKVGIPLTPIFYPWKLHIERQKETASN